MSNVNNKDIRTSRRQWRGSGVFIVNFEQIAHIFLVFLLQTLNKYMFAGYSAKLNSSEWAISRLYGSELNDAISNERGCSDWNRG